MSTQPAGNPWIIALVVTSAAFMEVLDTTIVNVALPHIAGTMSAGQNESTWALTSYLVANGMVLPISGWLADMFGRKRYFLLCIIGFTACSLLCGISTSLAELIVFRVLQGFFGGGLQPMQQAILIDTFPPAQRGRAFALTAIATVVAPAIGPTLGGWLTDNASWRWIFLINVPVGLLAWFFTMQMIEDPPQARAKAGTDRAPSIDYVGLGLIALGFGCLQVWLDKGEQYDWFASNFIRVFALLSAIGLVGAVAWLLTRKHPLVNLRLLGQRNFGVGNLLIFLVGAVLYGCAVLIPQLAQQQLGYTATWAGLVLSPGALAVIVLGPFVAASMSKVSGRTLIVIGFAIMTASLLYSAQIVPQIDFRTLVMMRAAQTIGLAFLFAPISAAATAELRPQDSNSGGALLSMSRNVGGSVGISIATALVTARSQVNMAYLSQHLSSLNPAYTELLQRMQNGIAALGHAAADAQALAMGSLYQTLRLQSTVLAYADVFERFAIAAALATLAAFFLKPKTAKPAAGGH
jgi:DHA2 family multidrug resistance protein